MFGAPDGNPTYLFFLLGLKYDRLHLPILGRLARALRNPATIAQAARVELARPAARAAPQGGRRRSAPGASRSRSRTERVQAQARPPAPAAGDPPAAAAKEGRGHHGREARRRARRAQGQAREGKGRRRGEGRRQDHGRRGRQARDSARKTGRQARREALIARVTPVASNVRPGARPVAIIERWGALPCIAIPMTFRPARADVQLDADVLVLRMPDGRQRRYPLDGCTPTTVDGFVAARIDARRMRRFVRMLILERAVDRHRRDHAAGSRRGRTQRRARARGAARSPRSSTRARGMRSRTGCSVAAASPRAAIADLARLAAIAIAAVRGADRRGRRAARARARVGRARPLCAAALDLETRCSAGRGGEALAARRGGPGLRARAMRRVRRAAARPPAVEWRSPSCAR